MERFSSMNFNVLILDICTKCFLIMLAFIESTKMHFERYFTGKLKGFYSSERGSFIVAIFFFFFFYFRFWFILERQWKNKFGLHGLWWRLNILIISLVRCARKASIWVMTFMLLLVNNTICLYIQID